MMTQQKAINIIDTVRCSNPFTMGLDTNQYIDNFKARWHMMFNETLETDEDVAIAILKLYGVLF